MLTLTKIHQTVYEQKGLHEALKAHHRGDSCTLERTELMKITPGFIPVPFLRHHCCVFSSLFLFSRLPGLSVLSVLSIIFYRRVCCGFWLTLNFPELTFASVCSQSRNSPASSHLFWRDFLKQQKELVEHSTDANVGVAIIRFYCQLTIISQPDVGCELKKARCTPHETTLSHIFNKIFSFFLKL